MTSLRATQILFITLSATAKLVEGTDYCHKDCSDYFPGNEFSECVKQHVDSAGCGLPIFAIAIITVIAIIVCLAFTCICIRMCMSASLYHTSQEAAATPSYFAPPPLYVNNPGPPVWTTQTPSAPPTYTNYGYENQNDSAPPPYSEVCKVQSANPNKEM